MHNLSIKSVGPLNKPVLIAREVIIKQKYFFTLPDLYLIPIDGSAYLKNNNMLFTTKQIYQINVKMSLLWQNWIFCLKKS